MFDLVGLAASVGYLGIFLIVFAESGLFFGFFLPGDSLLFTTGFLASKGVFEIVPLTIGIVVAAIFGDSVGYWSGKKAGQYLFTREESFWFSKKRLEMARRFFEKYGAVAIVVARFMPFVRTFTPIVAGAAAMKYRLFLTANIVGAMLWGIGVTLAGYYIGEVIPSVDRYVVPAAVIGFLIFTLLTSIMPLIRRYSKLKNPRNS